MIWTDAVAELSKTNTGFVVVTVLSVKGSSPRSEQTKMVVAAKRIFDSVGGGNLEFEAIKIARSMLQSAEANIEKHEYKLGPDLIQCCGGSVELLFEHFPACDFNVVLCGAGHVGKALMSILSELPCRVQWIDSRSEVLENAVADFTENSRIRSTKLLNPYQTIEQCPPGSWYLIMTHSHEMDFELCEAVLGREDLRYCGLIGSKSKAVNFRTRLKKKGFSDSEVSKLNSPIGIAVGSGKTPMEVAVSISAQLLQLYYGETDLKPEDVSKRFTVVGQRERGQ
ncbi:MAG: xanthine dehydrogenase accessory protein XdhC [bacterium]